MKKYFPLLFLLLFSASVTARYKAPNTQKAFTDSLTVIRQKIRVSDSNNSAAVGRVTDSLRKMQFDLAILQNKQGSLGWKDLITWTFTLGSLFISFYVLTREGKYKRLAFLSEVDKLLTNDPSLWCLYDVYNTQYAAANASATPVFTPKDQLDLDGKVRGFIYYLLNNFELTLPRRNYFTQKKTDSWENYIQEILKGSTSFRAIVVNAVPNPIFNPRFRQKLSAMLDYAGYNEDGTAKPSPPPIQPAQQPQP